MTAKNLMKLVYESLTMAQVEIKVKSVDY